MVTLALNVYIVCLEFGAVEVGRKVTLVLTFGVSHEVFECPPDVVGGVN